MIAMTKHEMMQRLIKDELVYGNAYIDPDKEEPLDPEEVVISDEEMDNWIIIDGFLKGSNIWVRKR